MADYQKEFMKCLSSIDYSQNKISIFQDFLTVSTISLANVVQKDEELEKEYFKIINKYKNPDKLAELLSITTLALEEKIQDFLGTIYMFGGFSNKSNGQFFTPYHISQFMSECTLYENDLQDKINKRGYITLSEPCCGAGGMILGCFETMLKMGFNPQKELLFQAVDIDLTCCQMTYIQTSLLGMCGEVIWGNSINMECWRKFVTPFYILNWFRFNNNKESEKVEQIECKPQIENEQEEYKPKIIVKTIKSENEQLRLF